MTQQTMTTEAGQETGQPPFPDEWRTIRGGREIHLVGLVRGHPLFRGGARIVTSPL